MLVATLAAGCSPLYVLKTGYGQLGMILDREPIEDVIADPGTPDEVREKLRLVSEARAWGEQFLGLKHTRNYEHFVRIEGDAVSYVVTACPADSLAPRTWWFPIAGSVPYLGFFDRSEAIARRDALRAEGFDASVRGATAFSTLGWFRDPVTSAFLERPIHDVIEVVFHETTHATVWIRGDAALNESLADCVGRHGSERFVVERFGPGSPEARALREAREDLALFKQLTRSLADELRAVYALDLPSADKISRKTDIFARFRERAREAVPRFHGERWSRLPDIELNNATVASMGVYDADAPRWERALAAEGGDIRLLLEAVKEAKRCGSVRAWLEAGGGAAR
jgi:predicted aminopeptidase